MCLADHDSIIVGAERQEERKTASKKDGSREKETEKD